MLCVEQREIDCQSGEEACFQGAEEETTCEERGVGVDKAGEGGDDAPCYGDEGEPASRGEEFEDQVRGNLEEEVGNEENGYGDLELLGAEAKVFLEVVEAGIADIDPVDVSMYADMRCESRDLPVEETEEIKAHDEWNHVHVQSSQ